MPLDLTKIRKLINGNTLSEIADKAGMAQPNLSRILSGQFDPRLSTVDRIARALGVAVKDILR